MDSKIFDLDRYQRKNMFMSWDVLGGFDWPETMIIDNEVKTSD